MANSVTSVSACPLVPVTTAAPVTTPIPGTGSTDVTTGSSTNFMCQDIIQMVEIKDQWNCRSCSRARIYGSVPGITPDHIMTMTFDTELVFDQLRFILISYASFTPCAMELEIKLKKDSLSAARYPNGWLSIE